MIKSGFKYCAIEPSGRYHAPLLSGLELRVNDDLRRPVEVMDRSNKLAKAKNYPAWKLANLAHSLSLDRRVDPLVIKKVTSYIAKFNYDMNPSALSKYFRDSARFYPCAVGRYWKKPNPPENLSAPANRWYLG